MGRPRVYDAEDIAREHVRTFKDRDVEYTRNFSWSWPSTLRNVGDSLAVAYASDKWTDKRGRGAGELYKHLAESRNRVYVKPGLLHDYYDPDDQWPVVGPRVSLKSWPMPADFAELGWFEEADLQLYVDGTSKNPQFGEGDEGIVKVTVRHGMLGGGMLLWSRVRGKNHGDDEPFIFVYTASAGVLMIMRGQELDIEKDGIVG